MMRGIVNDAVTFERTLVAREMLEGYKTFPVGLRIDVARVLADFRVNLTVRAEDYEMAVTSGALFDEINGVLFVPPRIDLKPLEKWLPFDLSRLQREGVTVSSRWTTTAASSRGSLAYPRRPARPSPTARLICPLRRTFGWRR